MNIKYNEYYAKFMRRKPEMTILWNYLFMYRCSHRA